MYIQQNKLFHALKVLEELRTEIAGFRVSVICSPTEVIV